MLSEKEKSSARELIERILQPNSNIRDSKSRQQAFLTIITSLMLAATCFLAGVIGLILGFPSILTIGLFALTILLSVAVVLGRTENFIVGSIFLVSCMILSGFLISSNFIESTYVIIILMSTIIPAFTFGIILLPLLAIIITAVVVIITIGILPLMASISPGTELLIFISLIIVQGIFILIAWLRDTSETLQQDEIGSLRGRLEERIEQRTRYSRIAAEIAQEIVAAKSMDELMNRAVNMISARMGFSFLGFYLPDEVEKTLSLKAAEGPDANRLLRSGKLFKFGPPQLLGWVAENKQQRIFTRMVEDTLQLESDLLPGNQSELAVPVLSGEKLLGVLDIQSTRTTVFDNETIVVLQMLANQIATAIQNIHIFEVERGSIQEVMEVYLAGYRVAQASNESEIYQTVQELFVKVPYVSMLLIPQGNGIKAVAKMSAQLPDGQPWPEVIPVSMNDIGTSIGSVPFIGEGSRLSSLPYNLVRFIQQLQIFSVAIIPVIHGGTLPAVLMIGTREKEPLTASNLQSYTNLAGLIANTRDRILEEQNSERLIEEMGAVNFQLQNANELAKRISRVNQIGEVFEATQRMFSHTSNAAILLMPEKDHFRVATSADPVKGGELSGLPEWVDVSPNEVMEQLDNKTLVIDVSSLKSIKDKQPYPESKKGGESESDSLQSLSAPLRRLLEQAQFRNMAIIPTMHSGELAMLLIIGTRDEEPFHPETVQTITDVADLVASSVARIDSYQNIEHRMNEMETISSVGKEISLMGDLRSIYTTLHSYVRQLMGNVNFLVAIYDPNTNSISIPYMYEKGLEDGEVKNIDSYPLGEGLISILIHTKQPLLLVEDTEKRAAALGAKIIDKPVKSWLGTPMMVSGEAIGALVVQDTENELAFDEYDLKLLSNLANQVAGSINNARLLEQTHGRTVQLQTAAEVARDISGSLDLSELLNKAVTLIYERFHFYHAAVFLLDATNEFAVIHEATGEAGIQMKRAGHKLKVGSKSIVGYVTGSGEVLIVNDTSRDATYYANPLLPETRSEVAIPLRVGQRVLGALDVQSTRPYSFGEEDVVVLRILADQMAIAVVNSELFADTQEHLSQHRLLHHVTTAAASGTTLEESLNSATQGLQVTLGGDRVAILLADKGKKTLSVKAFAGYSDEIRELEIPFGQGITGWVAVHQQSLRINDVTQDPRYIQAGSNIRSELAIPLSYRGDILGVLNVESDQVGAYNENDEELLGTLGGSLAAIISNARLIEQVRRQVDHERLLYEVTSKIRRSTDMQTIMATTTSELSKVLGARRAQIKLEIEGEPKKNNQTSPV